MAKLTKSLMISRKQLGEGKLELKLGETEDTLEPVGILQDHFYKGKCQGTTYKALKAQRLQSFHIRHDALENFIIPLSPNQTVTLRAGDAVGWGKLGTKYPQNRIISNPPENNDPRSRN